ncbi:DUF4362 domain-containing protein [Proteiniclasticum sp. BAD-10]|uniref:DUF4362 domain-containing protein n=1 Tax=Proteiniclasticum sediminis TaxID=2804028 RepID=A0A941HRB6_9CLOT|nr:DUF4362 domain-containing protein [Proteiniclasticum sediminis]MBR0577241.1 DUF4362 domain-containing protein [Proteiniclasticum sediminis]
MKKLKGIALLGILGVALLVFYGYFIHPNTYPEEVALKRGDVVVTAQGVIHGEKFHAFVQNVENQKPDSVRITWYSSEGAPKITDLQFDGKRIQYHGDLSRSGNERSWIPAYGEYTTMEKNDLNVYVLTDEAGKYDTLWVFQEKAP